MKDNKLISVLCLGLGLLVCCEASVAMSRVKLDRVQNATKKILADIVKLQKTDLTAATVKQYSDALRENIKILDGIKDETGKLEISRALLIDYISLLNELCDYVNAPTAEKTEILRTYGDTDPAIRPLIEHFVQ